MATPKIDISKQIALIDEHVKATTFRSASTDVRTTVCKYWNQAAPIVMLLGQILGKTAGLAIGAFAAAMAAYCADTKKASPAVLTKICTTWAKVKAFIAPAINLFGTKSQWAKALNGLTAGLDNLCAEINGPTEAS